MNIFQAAAAMDRARAVERLHLAAFPHLPGGREAVSDPHGMLTLQRLAMDRSAQLLIGRVVDAVAYPRCYKVQVEGMQHPLLCCDAVLTALVPYGARQLNTYGLGCLVVVMKHPRLSYGILLGAVPDFQVSAADSLSDFIVTGSRVGLRVDDIHAIPFILGQGRSLTDWSSSRPVDALNVGEWGAMTETGLAFFLDPFLAYVRVDEETGLFLFYHDQLTRLSGHNFQLRTALAEREDLDDRQEYVSCEGWSTYPWEARGFTRPDSVGHREFAAAEVQSGMYLARYEPLFDDLLPIRRWQIFRGYLGQVESRFLSAPAHGDRPCERLSVDAPVVGLYESHVSLTGRWMMRSLNGGCLGKTSFISVPKRRAAAADPQGDSPASYKYSGVWGEGRDHAVAGRLPLHPDTPHPEDEGWIRAAAVMDAMAYQSNWEALHPFHYHRKDWYVAEETAQPHADTFTSAVPDFSLISAVEPLPLPIKKGLTVDGRYGTVDYWCAESLLNFLDDGSVHLTDGYGSELLMSQGHIFLRAPGSVWIQTGCSLHALVGQDAVLRARRHVEMTSSQSSVAIKAETNLTALAGNGGDGGVLIESRGAYADPNFSSVGQAVSFSGVVVRSPSAPVCMVADSILLSTNLKAYGQEMHHGSPPADRPGEFVAGPILLDAGRSHVVVYADVMHRHIGQAVVDVFTTTDEAGAPLYRVNHSSALKTHFSSSVAVDGELNTSGCVVAAGHVQAGGLFANLSGLQVGTVAEADSLQTLAEDIADDSAALRDYASTARQEARDLFEETDVRLAEFSFWTDSQRGTGQLRLYESRWQQMMRQTGQGRTWTENASRQTAKAPPFDETYPFPGREAWTGLNGKRAFVIQDQVLYDYETHAKAPRGDGSSPSIYETAVLAAPEEVVMRDHYLLPDGGSP